MNFSIYSKLRQMRLQLMGNYEDITTELNGLTIYVSNVPKSSTKQDVAEALRVNDGCVELKNLENNDNFNVAFVQPRTWNDSTDILEDRKEATILGRKLSIKEAYDSDRLQPSHKYYKSHKLSEDDYDLSPACVDKPSIHCLNDDVLIHILGYLNLKEKLRIEAVCRRWQALIYSIEGRQKTIDIRAVDCPWRSLLYSVKPYCRRFNCPPGQKKLQKCKLIMYKMLILNEAHLTALHLDEHQCVIDVNVASAIGRLVPNLEVLSLRFSKNRCHYTSLRSIFSNCSKLKTFCVDNLESTEDLFAELHSCKSLEVLRLNYMSLLTIKNKLRLPLTELSLSDIFSFKLCLNKLLQPTLKTFRFFKTISMSRNTAAFDAKMLDKLLNACPDLTVLQIDYYYDTLPPRFPLLKNVKMLHMLIGSFGFMNAQLKTDLPAIEDFRIELLRDMMDEDFHDQQKYSLNFSEYLPTSVKSLTLPSQAFDDSTYESLLALPNLERIFFRNEIFSVDLLKKFVSKAQIIEIGAGMVKLTSRGVKELIKLRKKALADAGSNVQSTDLFCPLVLHLAPMAGGEGGFQDHIIKVVEVKGYSYLYDRVGSTHFDNEWTDFGLDFLQHQHNKFGFGCWEYSSLDNLREIDYDGFDTLSSSPDDCAGSYSGYDTSVSCGLDYYEDSDDF